MKKYQKSDPMIHRHRTAVFFFFVGTFFISACFVFFYAYGYRFSFERGIFVYTGSLSLKTNIDQVDIKINNVAVPEKRLGLLNNTISLTGISPGEYMLEVSAQNYKPWNKKIVIQSGLTTEFWNIFLTKDSYERVPVPETGGVIKVFPALNGLFATVKKNGNRYSVDVLDISGKENTEVFSTSDFSFLPLLETNIEWSPESHKLSIPLTKDDQTVYAIVDIKTKNAIFLNEITRITTPLQALRWDANTKNFLFFLNQGSLYRFNTAEPDSVPILITENVAAYDISGKQLYYLNQKNGLVYQANGIEKVSSPKQITSSAVPLDEHETYSLIVYDDTRLAVTEEGSGTLFVYNKIIKDLPLKKIGENIRSIQYSDDGKKLLFYTDNEISVYFNQDWEAQPARNKDSITQIARFSSPIKNIQWAEDYEHVIFSLGNSIKMIELDNRDHRDLSDILTLDAAPLQILPRFTTDTLYIVNEATSDTTLDNNTVFSITLPQYATNIFGL